MVNIIRVNKENYQEFSQLIHWRKMNKKPDKHVDYLDQDLKDFFEDFQVLDNKTLFIYALEDEGEMRAYITA